MPTIAALTIPRYHATTADENTTAPAFDVGRSVRRQPIELAGVRITGAVCLALECSGLHRSAPSCPSRLVVARVACRGVGERNRPERSMTLGGLLALTAKEFEFRVGEMPAETATPGSSTSGSRATSGWTVRDLAVG